MCDSSSLIVSQIIHLKNSMEGKLQEIKSRLLKAIESNSVRSPITQALVWTVEDIMVFEHQITLIKNCISVIINEIEKNDLLQILLSYKEYLVSVILKFSVPHSSSPIANLQENCCIQAKVNFIGELGYARTNLVYWIEKLEEINEGMDYEAWQDYTNLEKEEIKKYAESVQQ